MNGGTFMKWKSLKQGISLSIILGMLLSLWSPAATGAFVSSEKGEGHKIESIASLQKETANPFALMYDSDQRLAESLEEQWDILMKTHIKEIQMEGDQSAQMREESADDFFSSVRKPDQSSLSKRQAEDILQQRVISLARSGRLKDIQDLGLPKETAKQIKRMVEGSGESRFIVKYRHSARQNLGAETLRSHSAEKQVLGEGLELLALPENVNPATFAEELLAAGMESEIEYIQPDFALSIDSLHLNAAEEQVGDDAVVTPPVPAEENEPLPEEGETPSEEALPGEQSEEPQDESEKPALEEETSHSPTPVTVALIDTGVDTSHPALAGYLGEGWNFTENTAEIYNPEQPIRSAHGTHVAGTIAQVAEEYGADVTILPLMVFDGGLANTSDIISAITYAEEIGADIINCSFGSTSENPALYDAIASSNALFITAVGNSRRNLNEAPTYPACYDLPNLISVASVNADGGFSYFSNYSSDLVDITAPGREVTSTLPDGKYGLMTGTSMSAAQVSGGAAAVASLTRHERDIPLRAEALREMVLTSADELNNLGDKAVDGRRLNVANALNGDEGEYLNLNPADDFDVHGYHPTQSELYELYTSSGKVIQVAAGERHSLALKENGTVWAWGDNVYGQLGNETVAWSNSPVQVVGLTNVVAIAAGDSHNLALKQDNTVWAWGRNDYGQLGDGSESNRYAPVQVKGLYALAIAAGDVHSLALNTDLVAYAWGDNSYGQLGDGTDYPYRTLPEFVQVFYYANSIAAGGSHSVMLELGARRIFSWGSNYSGQLDGRHGEPRNTPMRATAFSNVKSIAAGGDNTLAIAEDGTLWGWGNRWRNGPIQAFSSMKAVSMAVNDCRGLVITAIGTVWAWDDYNMTTQPSFMPVEGLSNVTSVAAGGHHSLVVSDGDVWGWGSNNSGQLGVNNCDYSKTPVLAGLDPKQYSSIPTMLAGWTFTDLSQFDENRSAQATNGIFLDSTFGVEGTGELHLGTGNNTGQLYCDNWSNASDTNPKYWYINTTTKGCKDVEVTFSVHGSNTGPANFVVEVDYGAGWHRVDYYKVTNNTQRINMKLLTEANNVENLKLRFRVTSTNAINGGVIQSAGTSRIYDIAIMGVTENHLAEWVFTSKDQFDAESSAQATNGIFADSTFGVVGTGNVNMGTGSAAGQIYCNGWNNISSENEKYWYINTSSKGFMNLNITFGAHGSNTGPRNFVLEVDYGGGWEIVEQYALSSSSKMYSINLPSKANDKTNLNIRFRVIDQVSITGNVVQPEGTSRMYNIVVTGSLLKTGDAYAMLDIIRGKTYVASIIAENIVSFDGTTYIITYDASALQLLDFAAQLGTGSTVAGPIDDTSLTIISHSGGKIIFQFSNEVPEGYVWSGVISILRFKALKTTSTILNIA